MSFEKIHKQILIISFFLFSLISCEKESCLNCNTYNLFDFNGDLTNYTGTLSVCEFDDMWSLIEWQNLNNPGGTLYWFDLSEYQIGYRTMDNPDIDNDGIVNENDEDIDNDGVINLLDKTPYGNKNNTIWELLVCE